MNVQILTSSYPAFEGDPGGTAGLFVESFAKELVAQGHRVIVQPVARKAQYKSTSDIVIEPIPWGGGDQVLAAMNFALPKNWLIFKDFFQQGRQSTQAVHQKYNIDRTLCMWVIPCGVFGYWIHRDLKKPYDVWALGSDIWKIRKIPLVGNQWIKKIVGQASQVFADGVQLCADVKSISGRECEFLTSARTLPKPLDVKPLVPEGVQHFLFVGRYHPNKGPDLLLDALACLDTNIRSRIHVHMYGLGDLEAELRSKREQLKLSDCVTVNGPIEAQDLVNCLKRVDYLLIPSRIESIPVIFSDALQMGVPVISTPVGDLPRFIEDYKCGLLADEVSSEAFSKVIVQASSANRSDFLAGVTLAYQKFKINSSVKRWLSYGK